MMQALITGGRQQWSTGRPAGWLAELANKGQYSEDLRGQLRSREKFEFGKENRKQR